ncbi:MAG: hypothetical protein OEV43_00610 [Coriobacteriia bacterium]|nr:hypothetical protein [Coriobacteriia bacterium]
MTDAAFISVLISADLAQLEANLRQAESSVARSTDRMTQTVQRSGLSRAFAAATDPAVLNKFARSLSAVAVATQGDYSTTANAVTSVSTAMAMLPTPYLKIIGLAGVLTGQALGYRDAVLEAVKAEEERFRAMKQQVDDRTEAASLEVRNLRDMLAIEKEMDPIRKRELQLEYEKRQLRSEMLEMADQIDAKTSRNLYLAREALLIEKARQDVEAIRAKQADEAARLAEEEARRKAAMQAPSAAGIGLANSVTTSIGGMFNFAQNNILRGLQTAAMQQAGYQANLVLTAREILQILRNQGTVIT